VSLCDALGTTALELQVLGAAERMQYQSSSLYLYKLPTH